VRPFTVRPFTSAARGVLITVLTYPPLATPSQLEDISGIVGVKLEPDEICRLCEKMQLGPATLEGDSVVVTVPPTRSDVLHAVDVIEDVAIAYGFNKLIPGKMPDTLSVGAPLPINHFCDQVPSRVPGPLQLREQRVRFVAVRCAWTEGGGEGGGGG